VAVTTGMQAAWAEGAVAGNVPLAGPLPPSRPRISDFLSQERFHRLGVYAEFYRQVPVEHQIAIGLPPSDGRVIGIALNRGRGDFTEDDRDLLAVLRAPLVRATSRVRSRQRAR
jgi:hypothetical protein